MNIKIVSDLHLEFGDIDLPNNGADVLILSGDILVANALDTKNTKSYYQNLNKLFDNFIDRVCKEYKHVVYVFGNHEHYSGNYALTGSIIRNQYKDKDNLHILDCSRVVINDIVFIGGTLWTNFNKLNPVAIWEAKRMMNDFRTVTCFNENEKKRLLLPEDTVEYHQQMLKYIDEIYDQECMNERQPRRMVVVGHHAPSWQSIAPEYVTSSLNAAYASNLEDFIINKPGICLWTHGHVHHSFDYNIGNTRIVCNPRGYFKYDENSSFDPNIIIQI